MSEYLYTDPDGCIVRVTPSADHQPGAFVDPGTGRPDPSFQVPAHRLAEFTRALYSAAGKPPPKLPIIPDPALVNELAILLHSWKPGDNGGCWLFDNSQPNESERALASQLVISGWRKDGTQ